MGDFSAELILSNANVLTLNPDQPRARLVAVGRGRVLAVTDDAAMPKLRGTGTRVVDCGGRTVIPGFNDAHFHLVAYAESLLAPGLDWAAACSIADIKDRIRRLAHGLPAGVWIRAGEYNEFNLAEKRHPNRRDLDEATASHPVKLAHSSGHAVVLNSLALSLAGISRKTPEPPGGMIERDLETGEPNGLLYGMGEYLAQAVPPVSDAEMERGVKLAGEKLLSLGVTSIQDASPHNGLRHWLRFQRWKDSTVLKPRVSMMWSAGAFDEYRELGLAPKAGGEQLRPGAVKMVLDETRGWLNPPQDELNRIVFEIHRASFQVAIHAIEETTVAAACSALEYALQRSPRRGHRHRVEHCSVCPPPLAKRLAALGVVMATQPAFVYYNGERYLKTVPPEQLGHLYPVADLINAGCTVAAGSDCPVVPPDPIKGIYAAVFRKTAAGHDLLPEQGVSPLEALWLYTGGAAYASFEEDVKGSIVPGKLADLVVLNGDPTAVPAEEMKELSAVMTVIGGEIVWRKGI
ncbi:MAG: amidohydrolase [Chloroflexota bacterium]